MGILSGLSGLLTNKLLFFPVKVIGVYPSQLEIPYREGFFNNDDGHRLHGWFFPGKSDRTLFFLHGNAGNIGDRVDRIRFLSKIGWNIFIFDYRGFGGSEGSPTIKGVIQDSRAALRYLCETLGFQGEQIVLFGESLGGALAIELGSEAPFEAVILESTFTSLHEMAQTAYPFIPQALVPNAFHSVEKIRQLKSPLLVIHGTNDPVVPFSMGKKLFEAAPHPKRFYVVEGAVHNDVYLRGGSDYLKVLEEFLSEIGLP